MSEDVQPYGKKLTPITINFNVDGTITKQGTDEEIINSLTWTPNFALAVLTLKVLDLEKQVAKLINERKETSEF